MSLEDTKYYRGRAFEEATLAKNAACEVAAAVHSELALRYQALVDKAEGRSPVELGASNQGVSQRATLGVQWAVPVQS